MKFAVAIVFTALFAVVLAAPPHHGDAQVLRAESDVRTNGFSHALETSDGTNINAHGELKQIGKEAAVVSQGSYSYVADDGVTYTITYIADENGFQPSGAHLPVAPVA